MSNQRFALLTSAIGLVLCAAQTYKGHFDAQHERERLQEMHEQKMHYLHEFHRREIKDKEHRLGWLEEERRVTREAEAMRITGMFDSKGMSEGTLSSKGVAGASAVRGKAEVEKLRDEKEAMARRVLDAVREESELEEGIELKRSGEGREK